MAIPYGGGTADFATYRGRLVPGQAYIAWSAVTGGTQITGVTDPNGVPLAGDQIVADGNAMVSFLAPDGVVPIYLAAVGDTSGLRVRMDPSNMSSTLFGASAAISTLNAEMNEANDDIDNLNVYAHSLGTNLDAVAETVNVLNSEFDELSATVTPPQTFATKPDVSFALSWTDLRLAADDTTESTFGALEFPWLAKDGDTILMSYKDGKDSPIGGNYITRLKTSTDQGATWSTGTIVWSGTDDSGAFISVTAEGTYILASQIYVSDVAAGTYVKRSTDKGVTWSSNILVSDTAFAAGHTYTSTAPLQLANGDLILPVYGVDITDTKAKLFVSTNDGLTWSLRSTILAVGGVNINEVTIRQMADGTIVALARANDFVVRRVMSTDNGATWSAATSLWTDCDSRIDWYKMSSGKSVAFYRQQPDSYGYIRYSTDDWVTYSTSAQVIGPDKRTTYGSLIEVRPDVLLMVMGEVDDSEVNGRIWSRYVMNGFGLAPSGQNTYIEDARMAMGRANVVAYDQFRRPDNALGLGGAASGHQWLEFGGVASNNWKIVSNAAVNSGGTVKHSTMNTTLLNGFIEADILWSGTTSTNIGFVARRSTSTGRALFCDLHNAGQEMTFYYFDGSSTIELATSGTSVINVTGLTYTADIWYRMKLIFKGRNIQVFLDGKHILSYQCPTGSHIPVSGSDQTMGADLLDGTLWGIRGGGSSRTAKFKNLIVSS